MFDIGFSEVVVIAVVALIVIGPERLPKAARTMGLLFGRLQRYVGDVKADISREMELDELRKLQASVQDAAHAIEQTVNKEIKSTESELSSIATSAEQALQPVADTAPAIDAPSSDAATPAPATTVQGQLDLGSAAAPPVRKQG